jgi:hypothetical protein
MKAFTFLSAIIFYSLVINAQAPARGVPADMYSVVEDESELKPGENIDEKIRKNFFLRAEVSKEKCFVGEPIMATFKAYSRLDANSQVVKRPSLSGFSVIEMVDAYNNQPDIEKFNGKYFYVHLIRKVQLFPLQPGNFALEPAEVESVIQLRKAEEGGGMNRLRDLFRRNRKDALLQRQITFQSPVINIHVDPLPDKDQPADFSGAVGNFNIEMKMDDTTVTQNEPSLIKLMISGTGNFPLITDPAVNWPQGFQISDPYVLENVNKYVFPLAGVKTFQYTLEHRDTGIFTIPSISFSFFDPSSKTYKTIQSLPVHYSVLKSNHKKNLKPGNIIQAPVETPLQYYYFGGVALIIVALILYQVIRSAKRSSP